MVVRIVFILILLRISVPSRAQWDNPADRYKDTWKEWSEATCPLPKDTIRHFVYFARDREDLAAHPLLTHDRFTGAQIMHSWRDLEPEKGGYDFSVVEADIALLAGHGKKLFIQLQDATFYQWSKGHPAWLESPEYGGGATVQWTDDGELEGWVAKRWNPAVRARFAVFLNELGKALDGRIEGINLQETSIGVSPESDPSFTYSDYIEGLKANMSALKEAFPVSTTLQYANFMPIEWLPWDDQGYLKSIYDHGQATGVGLGAPDLMVQRRAQLNHTLAMMHESDFAVPLGIAVQDGNYIGQTGDRKVVKERDNIVPILHGFARDFLKVDYMFWSNEKPYVDEDLFICME